MNIYIWWLPVCLFIVCGPPVPVFCVPLLFVIFACCQICLLCQAHVFWHGHIPDIFLQRVPWEQSLSCSLLFVFCVVVPLCWKILRAYLDVVRRWLGYSWLKNMVVRRWLGRLAALASCAGWVAGWLRWLAVLAGCASWRRWLAGIGTAQHKSGLVSATHFWNSGNGTASNMPSFYSNVFRTLQNIMAADPWQSLKHPAASNHMRDLQLTCKTWIQPQTRLPTHLQDFQ